MKGYPPLPTGSKEALIVALNGCAAAPNRFAVLRLEVYDRIGPLFPKGMRIQQLLPNGSVSRGEQPLVPVGILCIGLAASGFHREARP